MALLADRYELGRPLGTGGMGEVVEAYDRKLGRRVAIKRLRAELGDPRALERFAREVRAAAALTHPNLVTVFDVGDDAGHPYFVMELVEGRTLAAAIGAGPLAVDESARIADAVLAGLAAAHRAGLVHRDVKPANVLLGHAGSIKLTDFGIARAVHDATASLTATGEVLGTPTYLAPEQAQGRSVPPTDLYAVGVLLYEMLAGAPPFLADTPLATALAHRSAPVPSLVARRPDVPPRLVAVVERALEKEPARRFPDADAMRTALRAAMRPTPAPAASAASDGAVTQPVTATATRVLTAAPSARTSQPSRRRALVPALVAGLALGAAVVGALLAVGGGGGDAEVPRADAAVTDRVASTLSPSTSTTTTTIPTPRTLEELFAVLAGNPSAYGERGFELLDHLGDVLEKPDRTGRRAGRLVDEVGEWVAAGELDPEVGGLARQLLVPFLAGTDWSDDSGESGRGDGFDPRSWGIDED
jgi:serine/threonine-protein kinase